MDLDELEKTWNEMGKLDPLWAIFPYSLKRGTGTPWDINEFFATGEKQVDADIEYIRSLGKGISRGRALDFGSGVGRLTQALAHYFDEVYGIDIAPSMIELAEKYNRHGNRCKYILNQKDNLRCFSDGYFTFIYSLAVLQHINPVYTKIYIKEFVRVLAPGGLLLFQLPSEPGNTVKGLIHLIAPAVLLNFYRKKKHRLPVAIETHGVKRSRVSEMLQRNGAKILDIREYRWGTWTDCVYYVTKE